MTQQLNLYSVEYDFATDEWINERSWKLTDDIMVCSFNGMRCSAQDFDVTYTKAGRCYTLRRLRNESGLVQTIPGSEGGLSLYINIQQSDYTTYTLLGDYQNEAGIKVTVQRPFEVPNVELGVSAMPGYAAFIPLQLEIVSSIIALVFAIIYQKDVPSCKFHH